ncbi:M14 family zinc carboxypeptidase [Ekhidna sp.]|uniref:M14 family zinc carboxypeptidase n=1 Tax=Ekhidna sp. TaxID=2608089 RepID=UPI003B509488
MKRILFAFLIAGIVSLVSNAQPQVVDQVRFAFEPDLQVNPDIPSPQQFLNYPLGENFTGYAHIVQYYKELAASSPRVLYNEYGTTYEGRPLINLVISSQENINNIDAIKETHLKLLTASDAEAQSIIENQPVFTSFSYNIHGNEASSSEAAMQVAYRMASANDQETLDILKNSVIIMYICINPDGRDRYVYWYKSMKRLGRAAVEPKDLEHFEDWPGGRTNHYWFDLNRDWIWGVHPESRGHTGEYQKWMPQVHVDYHEQGYNSNYFTMPGTTPRNKLLPDAYEPWSKVFGDANIAEFDKHQINYFTRDAFDFFYPGYGSSWPSVMGAIGMLTEQGGHSAGGRIVETDDGYHLTLRQRIFDHYTTSFATIKASANNRKELLQYSYNAWKPTNSKTNTKAYFFSNNDMYADELVRVLKRNGVSVYQSKGNFQLASAKDYRTGITGRRSLPQGTYIVPTDQPRALFINSIMERNMAIEDSVMYDMATWSAPIAYNIEAWSTAGSFSVDMQEVIEMPESQGEVVNNESKYAYVIDWSQRNAPQALSMLWAKKYNVRSAEKPFSDGNYQFPAGSLIILKGRNREKSKTIDEDIMKIALASGVKIVGFNSGRMLTGMDLANTGNRPVKQPKIAMMVDPPFSSYTGGQIYFLFDWITQLPIERIRTTALEQTSLPKQGFRFGGVDLKDYDVLILPGGGNTLKALFGEEQQKEIKEWVSDGGTLIATESAASFFTKENSEITEVEMKKSPKDSSDERHYLKYADREDYFGKRRVPGSAMNAIIDTTHPLAFGLKENLYTLKFGNDGIIPSDKVQTVGYYDKDPSQLLVAGYASKENLEHIAGLSFAGVASLGEGKIVYLIDNTQYRMFWLGPSRMMQNAVMILPGF